MNPTSLRSLPPRVVSLQTQHRTNAVRQSQAHRLMPQAPARPFPIGQDEIDCQIRPRVLFGNKPDYWEKMLPFLDTARFDASYGDLSELDLERYDYIVPWELSDSEVLLRRFAKPKEKALLIDPAVIDLCEDKRRFNDRVLQGKHGRMIPAELDVDTVLAASGDPATYPFILKCSTDAYGLNSFVIEGPEDLAAQMERINHPSFYLQEYVVGTTEVATHMLMRGGVVAYFANVVYAMPSDMYVRGIQTDPIGHSINYDTTYIDQLTEILLEIGLTDGTCCFNYKLNGAVPQIFEVNARFGASLSWDINKYLEAYINAVNLGKTRITLSFIY